MEKEEEDIVLNGFIEIPHICPSCKSLLILFMLGYIIGLWTSQYVIPVLSNIIFFNI
jgi:hypothetical protein